MRKLPILIFGIIQKPLQIKASKRPGDESINKTSEYTILLQYYYNIQLPCSSNYSVGAYFKHLLHVLPAHNAFLNFL